MTRERVLLVFLDGVGLGADDEAVNPLVTARLPFLTRLTGGRLVASASRTAGPGSGPGQGTLIGLDASLGVRGTPQSGTGQYSLLTGLNGAEQFGRHHGPYVPTALREWLQAESVLARCGRAGARVAFANAYPEELLAERGDDGRVRLHGPLRAGPPLAALGAGVLTRHTEALRQGDAIASEIVNTGWRERLLRDLPDITPTRAGENLARIAGAHDFTVFAHYSTDTAGHLQDYAESVAAIELVDTFLEAVFDTLAEDITVIIVSDHGNLEDVRTGHTLNPALCIVAGPARETIVPHLYSLMDIAPAVLRLVTA